MIHTECTEIRVTLRTTAAHVGERFLSWTTHHVVILSDCNGISVVKVGTFIANFKACNSFILIYGGEWPFCIAFGVPDEVLSIT